MRKVQEIFRKVFFLDRLKIAKSKSMFKKLIQINKSLSQVLHNWIRMAACTSLQNILTKLGSHGGGWNAVLYTAFYSQKGNFFLTFALSWQLNIFYKVIFVESYKLEPFSLVLFNQCNVVNLEKYKLSCFFSSKHWQ